MNNQKSFFSVAVVLYLLEIIIYILSCLGLVGCVIVGLRLVLKPIISYLVFTNDISDSWCYFLPMGCIKYVLGDRI